MSLTLGSTSWKCPRECLRHLVRSFVCRWSSILKIRVSVFYISYPWDTRLRISSRLRQGSVELHRFGPEDEIHGSRIAYNEVYESPDRGGPPEGQTGEQADLTEFSRRLTPLLSLSRSPSRPRPRRSKPRTSPHPSPP
jgi:hypothetical protein